MVTTRRQMIVSGSGAIGGYVLLCIPAEAGIGAFFQKMLTTLAKHFPPVQFAKYLKHQQWGQQLNSLYYDLMGQGYVSSPNAQTTGATHRDLIASSAFHVSNSPDNTPQNPMAFVRPGSATFMNVVDDRAQVTNISGLNYSALDRAGQLYTDQQGCDCAANYMLPAGAASQRNVRVDWDNGFVGTSITYPSNKASVNLTQEPSANVSRLPDGSRQYEVAHVVRLYDESGKLIWHTSRDQALTYRQTFPA